MDVKNITSILKRFFVSALLITGFTASASAGEIPREKPVFYPEDNLFKTEYASAELVFQALSEPEITAESAVLIDVSTGAVLYRKNSEAVIPPASMTKLVTLYIAYREISAGKLGKDEIIRVSRSADFRSLPPRSSLMFLEEGQEVTVLDLMKGLAVPSGNDAAIALAERISGSVDNFVVLMNDTVAGMGLNSIHFEDSSGLSAANTATASDFAAFCLEYINRFPDSINELHSLESFTYPKKENWAANGSSVYGPITQYSHIELTGRYLPVDGLKTGYIDESGYNVALTASLNGRRLVAVLMGGPGENSRQGSLNRAVDSVSLLSYGFNAFSTIRPSLPVIRSLRIWKAEKNTVEISLPELPVLCIRNELINSVKTEVVFPSVLAGPVKEGSRVGEIVISTGDGFLKSYEITAAETVSEGGFLRRLFDSLRLFFLGLFGKV